MDLLVDIGLWSGYILLGLATVLAIVLPLISSLSEPKSLMKAGIGILAILIVFAIGYMLAGDEIIPSYEAVEFTSPEMSKVVGGILTTMGIMLAAAFAGIVFTEINKMVK